MSVSGRRIEIQGTVQGVGFRPWVYRLACEEGVSGRVRNDGRGVLIEAFGEPEALGRFERRLESDAPPAAEVRWILARPLVADAPPGFEIDASQGEGERRVSIPPDLATCPECLRETADPADRRHLYPFTNCTHCGPRYTIARDVPYDRTSTTMAPFTMCPDCRREYDDPADRRFHAQPIACPVCGPRLELRRAGGAEEPGDPLPTAAAALRAGRIVAVKGLGGFHLACDATATGAVRRLRERKHRDEKPFAVMVRSLDDARALAALSPAEERLLSAVERPIVLVDRRLPSRLAPEVAPGNPLVGLMLAYTPLHDLLLRSVDRPLVMTSGNLTEEPMVIRDEEAIGRLAEIADLFLVHDREIENRSDDSVARVVAGRPVLLRRSRGYVPRPIRLARPVPIPILACGGHLKNAFCLASGEEAWLGPHIGDLESLEAIRSFEEQVERLQRFLGIRPELVAHDLHPDYASTSYARRRREVARVGVQHHHAHVASVMAEHGLEGPVLGLAWDGTGYGADGTSWGGELLLANAAGFERLGTLRPLRLAGGDEAVRQVWRIALAALDDAFDGNPPLERLRLFDGIPERHTAIVRRMAATGLQAPLAHGAGRYFDALGALGLGRAHASYEGQVALEWNLAAAEVEAEPYPFHVESDGAFLEADLRGLVRAAVGDLLGGVAPGLVSARFHETMAEVAADMVRRAAARHGPLPVVLSGGCFQNARLAEGIVRRLAADHELCLPGEVPPGDGGLALGQTLVAATVEGR
jgi:hydrogenase maturation protein HypF